MTDVASEMTNDSAADPGFGSNSELSVAYATDAADTVQTDAEFIDAYVVATGELTRVPAHYRDNPVLWAGLRKTPLSDKQQRDADALMAAAHPNDTPAAGDKE